MRFGRTIVLLGVAQKAGSNRKRVLFIRLELLLNPGAFQAGVELAPPPIERCGLNERTPAPVLAVDDGRQRRGGGSVMGE